MSLLTACPQLEPDLISLDVLAAGIWFAEEARSIDSTSNLAGQRIYLYSGLNDTVVSHGTMLKVQQQVRRLPPCDLR